MKYFFSVILFFLILGCSNNYNISFYRAGFETFENSNDIRVKLEIKYNMISGNKSEGFKFVGNDEVSDIKAYDDKEKPVKVVLERLKENKLTWYFDNISADEKKTIFVEFTLKNLLGTENNIKSIDISWAGVFKINVLESEFVLTLKEKPEIIKTIPENHAVNLKNGKWEIVSKQEPLQETRFSVNFK